MSDYIKKEDVRELLIASIGNVPRSVAEELADKALGTLDVVDIIRCKDCKHRKSVPNVCYGQRVYMDTMIDDNDFCSYGERKE